MNIKTLEFEKINEKLHIMEHPSGLKVFVINKKGYSKKYAAFATHYGSINSEFIIPGEKNVTRVPDGVAHFLEHKLFEQKDGSVMDKFSALGSSPNAYTGFNQTVYIFSCTDRFDDNFKLLMDYVQNPYITQESVDKEKGIIGQEIKMYEDDPSWRVFFNLLGSFYKVNPVKLDIAGTVDSISGIDRDVLYKCYNTFYHPSNMILVAVGDIEPSDVFKMVEDGIQQKAAMPEVKRVFPDEPFGINKDYVEQALAVSIPLFQMGFKDDKKVSGKDSLKYEIAVKILLNMIIGRSSVLYNQLYNEGLINSSFDHDFTIEENYAFSMIGGESPDPKKVRERFTKEIERLRIDSLNKDNFDRIKRAMTGRFLRQFNGVERISKGFIPTFFRGAYLFDYLEIYDKITFDYVNDVFKEHFNLQNLALSVIRPV